MAARTVKSLEASSSKEALVREMLERVADFHGFASGLAMSARNCSPRRWASSNVTGW
jgi:hypothetical protein